MPRLPADERRRQVIDAAISFFALTGFNGTNTSGIASAVGVSQPYLYQLFPTKKAIFIAACHEAYERILEALREGVRDCSPDARLGVLAASYDDLLKSNRELLTIQIQVWAASCSDEEIAEATRAGLEKMRELAMELLGVSWDDADRIISALSYYNISAGVGLASRNGCTVSGLLASSREASA